MNNQSPNTPVAAQQPSGSTGPRTEAGKAVSSQNARKHDLCSRTLRLSPEEWVEYNDLCARYRHDLKPANDPEQTLVDEICFNYWRLQQARVAELQIILEHPTELPIIALYIRYRTGYERGFYKALDRLQKAQADRQKQGLARQAAVRSAKSVYQSEDTETSTNAQVTEPGRVVVSPASSAPVRSENTEPNKSAQLQEQIEDHLLENRVRAELLLAPLPLPQSLRKQADDFVSQNPTLSHKELNHLLRRAA